MLEGRASIQKVLDRVKGVAGRNLMKFNKSCTWEGGTICNKSGDVLVGEQPLRKGTQSLGKQQAQCQCALTARQTNCTMY